MNAIKRRLSLGLSGLIMSAKSTPLQLLISSLFKFNREVIETPKGKFFVNPLSHFGYLLMQHGYYEPWMEELLERFIKPGNTFIDLGAHEGYYTVMASKLVGPAGRVVAVEAQTARVVPILQENLRLNAADNVTVIPCAVSDRRGTETIHLAFEFNTGSSGVVNISRLKVPTESVEVVTLSDIFTRASVDYADLLKLDIEGCEYEAVFGSPEIFREKRVRTIIIELHPWQLRQRGHDPQQIIRFLEGHGYVKEQSHLTLVFKIRESIDFPAPHSQASVPA